MRMSRRRSGYLRCSGRDLSRGLKTIGDDYPFRIDDNGHAIRFITPVTKVGSVYLFCLFLSHAFDRTIMPKELAPKITNKTRDLFQACATVAAGGYVHRASNFLRIPTAGRSAFLKALQQVYRAVRRWETLSATPRRRRRGKSRTTAST